MEIVIYASYFKRQMAKWTFDSTPPEVKLVDITRLPSLVIPASARTCYAKKGIVPVEKLEKEKEGQFNL